MRKRTGDSFPVTTNGPIQGFCSFLDCPISVMNLSYRLSLRHPMCGCEAVSHWSVFVAFVHYVDFLWQSRGPKTLLLLAPPHNLMGLDAAGFQPHPS